MSLGRALGHRHVDFFLARDTRADAFSDRKRSKRSKPKLASEWLAAVPAVQRVFVPRILRRRGADAAARQRLGVSRLEKSRAPFPFRGCVRGGRQGCVLAELSAAGRAPQGWGVHFAFSRCAA